MSGYRRSGRSRGRFVAMLPVPMSAVHGDQREPSPTLTCECGWQRWVYF